VPSLLVLAAVGTAACSSSPPPPTCGSIDAGAEDTNKPTGCRSYDALVATTDYSASAVGVVSLSGALNFVPAADLGVDPVLTTSAGRYFWIARDLGTIIEVDPSCLHAKATYDANDPDGSGTTNPQDVAVAPDGSLWIARFNVPTLLVLSADGCTRHTIDLSSLDPVTHNPRAASIKILDPKEPTGSSGSMTTSKAYVDLEMLDDNTNETSTRPSLLVQLDLEKLTVDRSIELKGQNPIGLMVQVGTQLYLADASNWGSASGEPPLGLDQNKGGIELVDTATFTSRLLVDDVTLGGHTVEVAVQKDCGVAIIAGAYAQGALTSLIHFDPATGAVADPAERTVLPTTADADINGLAWLGDDVLLVGDRSAIAGGYPIHVFDLASPCTLTERANPLVTPLPPAGIIALH
jgi:hypothetical protein